MNQIAWVAACLSVLVLPAWHRDTLVAGGQPPGQVGGAAKAPGAGLPVLGDCNLVPNYATSKLAAMPGSGPGRLRRWRSFPITYSVDTSSLPAGVQTLYAQAGVVARDLWSSATAERVGQLRPVDSGGQISVRLVSPESIPSAGVTTIGGVGDAITSAAIQVARYPDDVSLIERGLQRRVILHTANTLAHEIGHALGIQLHSPDASDLMHEDGNFLPGRDDDRDPRSFITTADRNTMLQAYCR